MSPTSESISTVITWPAAAPRMNVCVTSGVMLSRISTWSAPGAKFTRCTDWPGLCCGLLLWRLLGRLLRGRRAPGDSHGHRVGGVASRRRDVDPVAAVLRQRPGPRGPLRRCGHGRAVGGEHVERAVPLHRGDRHVHQLAGARRQVPPVGGAEQHRPADGAGVGTWGERQALQQPDVLAHRGVDPHVEGVVGGAAGAGHLHRVVAARRQHALPERLALGRVRRHGCQHLTVRCEHGEHGVVVDRVDVQRHRLAGPGIEDPPVAVRRIDRPGASGAVGAGGELDALGVERRRRGGRGGRRRRRCRSSPRGRRRGGASGRGGSGHEGRMLRS